MIRYLILFSLLLSVLAGAAPKTVTVAQDGAMIYEKDNFDSNILAYLSKGETLTLLTEKKFSLYFYKVKTKDGVQGFISDVDVSGASKKSKAIKKKSDKAKTSGSAKRRALPMDSSAYFGIGAERIEFREKTAGGLKKQFLSATSLHFLGPDFLMSGEAQTELNIALYTNTPEYYEDVTGQSTGRGLLLLMDFLAFTPFDVSDNSMTYFSFGPMIRHSSFNVQTVIGGKTQSYNLTNVNLGLSFEFGYMYRISRVALRFDWKYYWEKMQHNSLGVSLMYEL